MRPAIHSNLANGKWLTMTLPEQLGNIGSEFERALRWKEKNQQSMFEKARERMLELFDLTLSDPRWHNHRARELTRAREAACAELYDDSEFVKNSDSLKKYFLQFATLARK